MRSIHAHVLRRASIYALSAEEPRTLQDWEVGLEGKCTTTQSRYIYVYYSTPFTHVDSLIIYISTTIHSEMAFYSFYLYIPLI